MKRERDGDARAADNDAVAHQEDVANLDMVDIADINDLMNKCQTIQQQSGGCEDDKVDEEGAKENDDESQSADEVLATVQDLLAKCELVQQTARDMNEESFWVTRLAESSSTYKPTQEEDDK